LFFENQLSEKKEREKGVLNAAAMGIKKLTWQIR